MSIQKIAIETIKLTANSNLVLRNGVHGVEMEIHTPEGAFAVPEEEVARIRAFGAAPITTSKVPRAAKRSNSVAPSTGEKPKSKMARRYSTEEKTSMVAGYDDAPNKAEFCRTNDVGVDTIRRWKKAESK